MRTLKPYQWHRLLLIILALFLMGSRDGCDRRTATLTCTNQNLNLTPGTCATLTNPCANNLWSNLPQVDAFRLCDEPAGLMIQTTRVDGNTVRSICASASVGTLINQSVGNYLYVRGRDFGASSLFVTTVSPLVVTVSASPTTINNGETSQLNAVASGGAPPYSYSWVPVSTLSNPSIANPVAQPSITTTYQVTVSDSEGQSLSRSVTITVNSSLVVTANPPVINVGVSSGLDAIGGGGTPPYSFSWVPTTTLDNPSIRNPIASPVNTTTYTLTMTDSVGAVVSGSVTVTVNILVNATATPASINLGDSSQLNATAQGGLPPYTYSWMPTTTLNNPALQNPIATPAATTLYTVVVTDSIGANASGNATVTINAPTGLTACFTFTSSPDGSGNNLVTLDATCSTAGLGGPIVNYTWVRSWTTQILSQTSPFRTILVPGGTVGTITLTVRDASGAMASVSQNFPGP